MDKIKLANGTEISISNSMAGIDNLTVTFIGVTDFAGLREDLTKDNLAEIQIITNGNLTGVYEGYVKISPYIIDVEDVTVTFTKEDEVQVRLSELETANEELQTSMNVLQDMLVIMM